MIFCTLFNWKYLPQGIALYRSLSRTCEAGFKLYALCMDGFTVDVLAQLKFPHLEVLPLHFIEGEELKAVRSSRTVGEYCWTCTAPLLLYLLEAYPRDSVVTYVDADLRFFSDPCIVLSELGSGSIFVHEHDFAPEYAGNGRSSGRFNVGLLSVRNNEEGMACLRRWKAQCLEECVYDPAAGKCGDQNYLDEWPERYPGLVISSNPGIGLAPWNISKFRLGGGETCDGAGRRSVLNRWHCSNDANMTVDGHPILFYHYHSLQMLRPRLGFKPVAMALGYSLSEEVVKLLYHPYARDLWRSMRTVNKTPEVTKLGRPLTRDLRPVPSLYPRLQSDQMLFSLLRVGVPRTRNAALLSALYGLESDVPTV